MIAQRKILRKNKEKKIQVLMCCSDLKRVKGGMVTMVNNLLSFNGWEDCRITYVPTHIEARKFSKLLYFAVAYLKIVMLFLCGSVDIVHLHVSERGSVYRKAMLLKLAKRFGKKVILHHHGADFEMFFQELSSKEKQFVVDFLERADRNLVLSEGVMAEFQKKAPHAKYTVVRNAVTVPDHNPYFSEANLIVTMGRLGERKGTFDLLRALKKLDAELPENIKVCLCGDGDIEQVAKTVRDYGLEQRVSHIGWVSGEKKKKIMQYAMCHVLPSYREVLPMSILETMAHGIPNISTRIASIPEVIEHDKQGLLVEPGKVEQLTEALRYICLNVEKRNQMSLEAYDLILREYSVEACSKKMRKIYKEVAYGND